MTRLPQSDRPMKSVGEAQISYYTFERAAAKRHCICSMLLAHTPKPTIALRHSLLFFKQLAEAGLIVVASPPFLHHHSPEAHSRSLNTATYDCIARRTDFIAPAFHSVFGFAVISATKLPSPTNSTPSPPTRPPHQPSPKPWSAAAIHPPRPYRFPFQSVQASTAPPTCAPFSPAAP